MRIKIVFKKPQDPPDDFQPLIDMSISLRMSVSRMMQFADSFPSGGMTGLAA